MGKAIVYCQGCGRSLYEEDFERGRASRNDGHSYCAACKAPAPAPTPRTPPPAAPRTPPTPPATHRRTLSDRIPVQRSSPTARIPKVAKPRSSAPLLWSSLAFIGIVGAVGATIVLGGRPSTSPDNPTPLEETPPPPRPKLAPAPVERDVAQLRLLLAAPPAEWKREEIDVLLGRRPELGGLRKEYARGLLGLGLRDGLVGHWTLDETDGMLARDSSGRGNDGKILGAPPRVRGKIGGAFQFRGNDEDGVEIPAANELDTLEAKSFSLCAWFLPEKVPPGKIEKSNDAWYGLLIRPGMHIGLSYDRFGRAEMGYWYGEKKNAMHHSADTIAPGAWVHAVGIVDAAVGRTRIFVNGRPSGEREWPARSRSLPLGSPWRIGIAVPKAMEWSWSMRGSIDDVRYYARALAAEEIALLAEATPLPSGAPAGRTPSNEGLVLHLQADAGVAADAGAVNAWADVERNRVTRSDADERPTSTAAEGRTSIVFDGRNDRMVLPPAAELSFKESDSFTLMARVRLEAAPKGRWMGVFAMSVEKPPWYGIWIDDAGRWVFGSGLNLHGSPAKAGGSTVAAVQLGGRERRLYVDGLRVATGPSMDASGAGDLWIGGVKGKGEYLAGAIQEIRLWRRALDASELIGK